MDGLISILISLLRGNGVEIFERIYRGFWMGWILEGAPVEVLEEEEVRVRE